MPRSKQEKRMEAWKTHRRGFDVSIGDTAIDLNDHLSNKIYGDAYKVRLNTKTLEVSVSRVEATNSAHAGKMFADELTECHDELEALRQFRFTEEDYTKAELAAMRRIERRRQQVNSGRTIGLLEQPEQEQPEQSMTLMEMDNAEVQQDIAECEKRLAKLEQVMTDYPAKKMH